MPIRIKELWRYPVKSLAGERITEAMLGPNGIPGDRIVHVAGPEGVRTARHYHRLLGLRGTLGPAGPLINGHPWDSEDALEMIKQAAGTDAWLEAWDGPERFDILPLLVATDGAVAAFDRDVRRLRPNILLSGVEGLDERTWEGALLHIGSAVLRLESLRGRCVMITVDPDTLERNPEVLKDVGRRFGGRLALDTDIERGGLVRVGDEVTLVRHDQPARAR
jgi:MOSC domain-containing protein